MGCQETSGRCPKGKSQEENETFHIPNKRLLPKWLKTIKLSIRYPRIFSKNHSAAGMDRWCKILPEQASLMEPSMGTLG